MKKKDKVTRICKNELCKKEFLCDNWRPKKYCSLDCALHDPNKINLMKGTSLKNVLIYKYGEENGIKKFDETRFKISNTLKQRFENITEEEKKKHGKLGSSNNMYGKSVYDVWVRKYGEEIAKEKLIDYGKKLSLSRIGHEVSLDTISKIRLAKIKRIENEIKKGISPRYNPFACLVIDEFGKNNNYNFQHAENGGEFFVKNVGCFLDGYDKDNNVAIEYYERFHYNIDESLKIKDAKREMAIIKELGCVFFRINAFNKNNIKIEMIGNTGSWKSYPDVTKMLKL